jgi:hypothetical protein
MPALVDHTYSSADEAVEASALWGCEVICETTEANYDRLLDLTKNWWTEGGSLYFEECGSGKPWRVALLGIQT